MFGKNASKGVDIILTRYTTKTSKTSFHVCQFQINLFSRRTTMTYISASSYFCSGLFVTLYFPTLATGNLAAESSIPPRRVLESTNSFWDLASFVALGSRPVPRPGNERTPTEIHYEDGKQNKTNKTKQTKLSKAKQRKKKTKQSKIEQKPKH